MPLNPLAGRGLPPRHLPAQRLDRIMGYLHLEPHCQPLTSPHLNPCFGKSPPHRIRELLGIVETIKTEVASHHTGFSATLACSQQRLGNQPTRAESFTM